MEQSQTILMYSTSWCKDCKQAKRFFDANQIEYTVIDVDDDKEGLSIVKKLNNGIRIVPTIVFPDGSILVEPSDAELAVKLGIAA